MFRRSRFSIRPNVGTAGRTTATPQEASSSNQESSETPKDISESSTPIAVTDITSDVAPSEKTTAPVDGNDQNVEGASSSAAVQRRKRFSVKPKVAPGRPSTLARTSRSLAKADAETPVEAPGSDLEKPSTSIQTGTTAAPQGLQSPRRRRRSEESKQPKAQPKPAPDSSEPSAVLLPEDSLEQMDQPVDSGLQLESKSSSQVEEVPPRPPDKVLFSIPDREAVELSERAKSLVSSKSGHSLSQSALSLSRLLNDPSDLQRLAKAQKLRELLKQEKHKEKKLKKMKPHVKEYTLDPTKMTMRDLIHYLPLSNPMSSSVEDITQENETVLPPSPAREPSPEKVPEPEAPPELPSTVEDEEEMAEEEDDSLMVPQVKVAEDGSLIIDEESLTVEVQRAKGPNPAQDRDPIFERGSTTTYSSFRRSTYSKPWSSEETDMFYLSVSMVGTDFSMICQLFPHRARSEIKNKFKKEERENSWRVDKAFRERRKLDIEYFSKLLEKILEVQNTRKKLKTLVKKNNSPKKTKRTAKGKKAESTLSDVEEENEEDADEVPNLEDEEEEEEGEKENENLCNEGGTPVSKPKKQRKRKAKQAALNEEANDKKKKNGEKNNEQGEACIPEDPEATLAEDQTTPDLSEKTENVNASKNTAIKPAKLSRGRAPKPLLPLGRKWSKKLPPDSTKAKDISSDKEDESVTDGASKEQVNQDSSPLREDNRRKSDDADISSEEEDVTAPPPRPTRYGRVPKPTKPLNYPAKDESTSAANSSPASPVMSAAASAAKPKPKGPAKRERSSKKQSAQQSKKPKLVTLRTSRSDFSDDDEEQQDREEIEEEDYSLCSTGEDSTAPVFVPASLRSPHPVISEVEETMEELDILANMPDVLGLSQDVLCPDSSFELTQNDTGSAEPCEHQLDLLVDVIDFLSSEHPEVTEDESYNEAAQTLLTIGNLTQLSEQSQIGTEDHTTGTTSLSAEETEQHLGDADQEENCEIHIMFDHGDTEISELIATVEPQQGTTDSGDAPMVETSEQSCGGQKTVSYTDFSPQLESSPESANKHSPQTRKGRLSKVKPKPNLGGGSRTEKPKSQPGTSKEQTAGETNTQASNIQVTESPSVKHTEELRVTQDRLGAAALDQSASEHQSQCFSDAQLEPSGEQATRDEMLDEKLKSHAEIIQSSSSNFETSETSDSVPVHEGSQPSAAFFTPVDDAPISQKETSEAASTSQIKRGRSQKVKPKPILAQAPRTARSKPQTTKATVEKDPSPTPEPQIHANTREVESEATSSDSPEKPNQSSGPAAALIPSIDLGSTHTPAIELSTTEEKRTEGGLDQSVSQNQILSEPSNRNTGSTSESTDEKMATSDDATESRDNLATAVTVSQVGQDSAPVPESSDHPASSVTPVDAVAVSQKEKSEAASTSLIKRGRSQKVKPKPILAQTTRTARSKPQTTNATEEKDPSQTPDPQIHEKTIEVEPEATSSTSPEKPKQSTGAAAALKPLFDLGSTLTPIEDLSNRELDQIVSQNQILSEPSNRDTGSTSGSTDEKMATLDAIAESSDNLVTSDSAVTKSQVGQDSASKFNDYPAPSVIAVDDVAVSQKEESEAASTSQIKRGRSQKVKPKPNLAQTTRTARSKPQTTEDSEKDSSTTLVPKVNEKTDVESEAICGTSPEKPSHSTGPASVLIPLFDLGSTLTATQELSTSEERGTADALVGQVYSQNQRFSETSYIDTGSTSGSTDDKMATGDAASVQESTDPPASFVTSEDLLVNQKEEREEASTSQIRRGRAQKIKPKPNLAPTSRIARSKPQTTIDPVMQVQLMETPSSPTVKPQSTKKTTAEMEAPPIYSISLPIQSTDTSMVSVPSLELCSTQKPTEASSATMEQQTEVGLNSTLKSSKPNVPHGRQQFSKVKPNLGSSSKTTQIKLQKTISEPSVMDTSSNVTSEPSSAPAEKKAEGTSSDGIVMATSCVAENQSLLPDTIPESEISEMSTFERKSTRDKMSNNDSVEAGPVSQVSDPITALESQSPEGGSTESNISSVLATNVFSIKTVHPTESHPHSCPESDSEVKSQCSETRETCQTSNDKTQSTSRTDSSKLELTDSSKSTKKGPQSRRGRLIIPKPNLGRSSRPPQSQQVRSPARAQADSGAQSQSFDTTVSLNPVSEFRPDIPDPVEGAVDSHSHQESCPNDAQSLMGLTQFIHQESDSHSNDAVSSMGCGTQAVDNFSQNTSTLGTEGTQSHPCLTIFPDLTSEPMSPGSDVPFFILSLSEIPVGSSGELMDSGEGHLPYLPDGDAPVQQQSAPGESLAPEEYTSLSIVPVSMSLEGSSEMGFLGVKDDGRDSAVHEVLVMENPETVESNAKTETHLAKKRISGTGRRAKVQVKPNTTKKTQASKTVAANTNQESGLPGPSTQAEASDTKTTTGKVGVTEPQKRSGDHGDKEKETPSVGKSPEDGSPRAQTQTKTRRMITRARKPDDFPSFLSDANTSDPPPGKAVSKGPKVQTQRSGKHSSSTPAASTAPSPGHTEQPQKLSHSTSSTTSPALTTPSTSQCTAEVSAPQQSDGVESSATEVEPTSVSQYFISDIFTEVE